MFNWMTSRVTEISVIVLIIIYSLLVLANVILDDTCNEDSSSTDDVLKGLKYTEIVILVLFALEIIFKCYAFGIKVRKI